MFQSTHSRGVRRLIANKGGTRSGFQSTHSRGVRHSSSVLMSSVKCFNPRTHEECDRLFLMAASWMTVSIHALTRSATSALDGIGISSKFQSTHSRGVRHLLRSFVVVLTCFNPRTHEECDCIHFFSLDFKYLKHSFRELF